MTISPPNRVGMAQENLSRYLEQFKSRWQPKDDGVRELYYDRRDFEIELTNLVQVAFAAAQAPFAAELDAFRRCSLDTRLLQSSAELVVRRGVDF